MLSDVVDARAKCHGAAGALTRGMVPSEQESLRAAVAGPDRRGQRRPRGELPREFCRDKVTRFSRSRTAARTLPARGASDGSGLWLRASGSKNGISGIAVCGLMLKFGLATAMLGLVHGTAVTKGTGDDC